MKAYPIRTNGEIYEPELTEERMKSMGNNHRKEKDRECNCSRPYEIELTNDEYLRTCTTEQLAEVLADVALSVHPFMKQKNRFELLKKQFYEWLKQPHTTKE